MSIEVIKKILEKVSTGQSWSLKIIKINTSKKKGLEYIAREIELSHKGRLTDHINSLASKYLNDQESGLSQYRECKKYDGTADAQVIYKLENSNELIEKNYGLFLTALAKPDVEINPLKLKAKASVIEGIIKIENEEVAVKFISMQNPVTTLNNKFCWINDKFTEISDKVLTLRNSIDVIVFRENVYMLNLAGEKLFDMERAYQKICKSKVALIQEKNIIEGFDIFEKKATTGHNPRKFVSFNDTYLNKLEDEKNREKIAQKFNIKLTDNRNLFDASEEGVPDKIVKLLCQKGMVDPFDDSPMEVSGTRKWI
ncbi:Kiwa anti-phage protein KwaB-like domain-containing protein [Streptococcus oralis]|uniref:Kiwa anti-phage protein KwaB-like domain-containing protein n=1 Tax=Streptococcus oralis TaxID=1303 RepID=UPI0020010B1B|nr:Kiwa anti-phage protein KwaB-like domain-containing protein [Streptococcus oralis]MCY7098777.1 DUF4868 domain-containing protein [Streptococcus oralis]